MRQFYGALLLGLMLLSLMSPATVAGAVTRRQLVLDFSANSIDSSGGALLHPEARNATILACFAITNILQILKAWNETDALLPEHNLIENLTSWIQDRQNTTDIVNNTNYGGFYADHKANMTTIQYTHYAVASLALLNQTFSIDYQLVVNFTSNLQLTNITKYPDTAGGFMNFFNGTPTVAATYYALEVLDLYNELSRANSSLALSWLNSSQILTTPTTASYGGFVNGREATIADIQSTFMAIRGLQILSSLNAMNQSAAINFILSCYQSDSNYPQYQGGFSSTPDSIVATPLATYYAVAALAILGATNQLVTNDIMDYILSKQTTNGGFADAADLIGLTPQTYYCIGTLELLDQTEALLEIIETDPYEFPWWVVGLAVVIVFVAILIYIARRREWI